MTFLGYLELFLFKIAYWILFSLTIYSLLILLYEAGWSHCNLKESIFADSITVLNLGVILGTFITSAAGGLLKFTKITLDNFAASVTDGLLMGYGALLAFGCNIGAYFGVSPLSVYMAIFGAC